MERYPFIFSNERRYRVQRHLALWTSWWLFSTIIYSFAAPAMMVPYAQRLPMVATEAVIYLVPHMFLAYTLMYGIIPRFLLRGKYVQTAISTIALVLCTALLSAAIGAWVLQSVHCLFTGQKFIASRTAYSAGIFMGLMAGLRGSLTIGGLAAAIKLMKYWYMKEQRNLQLQKENAETQLQLLKAQVHPHFLFNTLNNIYSHTQHTAPIGAKLVLGLSDMLRYMLYETNYPLVPLSKELSLLRNYILLEEIRYNHNLDLNLELPDDTDNLFIAPLLLLPFVENCFKHGASQVLEQPWVSLKITLDGRQMKMKLMNGKAEGRSVHSGGGIGIANVEKRLELLYPNRHNLKITDTEDTYIVNLTLDLERMTVIHELQKPKLRTHA